MRASLYLGPFFPGTARFVNAQTILRTRELEIIIHLSAALAKSGPLDFLSEKSFLLFYAHEKGLGHMFQKWFSCSPILFFLRRHKPKMIFGQTTPVTSDRKCKERFCPVRSDCNNIAHGILSCYKLQDVFS